jgi:hypothetical protein
LNACSMKYAIFEKERKEPGYAEDDDALSTKCSLNVGPVSRAVGFQIKRSVHVLRPGYR